MLGQDDTNTGSNVPDESKNTEPGGPPKEETTLPQAPRPGPGVPPPGPIAPAEAPPIPGEAPPAPIAPPPRPIAPPEANIAEEVRSSAIEVIESASEGAITRPNPSELQRIKEDIELGAATNLERLIGLIKARYLELDHTVIDLLIFSAPLNDGAVKLLFKNSHLLTEDQQVKLFNQLNEYYGLRDKWLHHFFKKGKLNPHLPEIHEGLLKTGYGLDILIGLADDDQYRPTAEQALAFETRLLAAGRYGLYIFNRLANRSQAPFPLPDELREQFNEKNTLYRDSDLFFHSLHEEADFHQKVEAHLQSIEAGTEDKSSPVVQSLQRLRVRDQAGYNLLLENIHDLSPDFMQTIIEGNFLEGIDTEGRKIRAYEGKPLGRGSFGRVFMTAYVAEAGKKLAYKALKMPHEHKKHFFLYERNSAALIREWNHPQINRPLHICEDFIIFESGPRAKHFREACGELSPRESMRLFIEAMKGVREYQQRGHFHGDIKSENILVFDTAEGKRSMLIDNSPVKITGEIIVQNDKGELAPSWIHTPNFTIKGSHLSHIAEDPEQRFYGIDNYGLFYTYFLDYLKAVKDELTGAQFSAIDTIFRDFSSPEEMSKPDALGKLMEKLAQNLHLLPDEPPSAKE